MSREWAYHLVNGNFAKQYENTSKEDPGEMDTDITFQPEALTRFILNRISEVEDGNGNVSEVKDFYTCPLLNGCYFEITVRKHNDRVFIIAGGGC